MVVDNQRGDLGYDYNTLKEMLSVKNLHVERLDDYLGIGDNNVLEEEIIEEEIIEDINENDFNEDFNNEDFNNENVNHFNLDQFIN